MTREERRARKLESDAKLLEGLRALYAQRVAAGQCRHCGGCVPCFSGFGDAAVGVRHTRRSVLQMLRKEGKR